MSGWYFFTSLLFKLAQRAPYLVMVLLLNSLIYAQHPHAVIKGKVLNEAGEPLEFATVYSNRTPDGVTTKSDGTFRLNVRPGKHEVICTMLGYQQIKKEVILSPRQETNLTFTLVTDEKLKLNEVVVKAPTAIEQVRESPFNVVALDAKASYNTTLDLAHMLDKAPGVKIREAGGVGSDMNISLNGFTGRHVKIFMDGVPMQGQGNAFQLNNIPVSIAERIEVYKGVVPIEFGADAIGGVINIVTNRTTNTFVDASYSYGSFNTHRTNVVVGHTTPKGISVQLNAYQNYSDNNYWIKSKVLQENFQYTRDEKRVRRFHDNYHNEAIVGKVGWVNKPWADRFFVGLTLSQQAKEIQNSASNIMFVYGARTNSSKSVLPSVEYYKQNLLVDGLTVRVTGNYNYNTNSNVDTASYRYNWYGHQIASPVKGEVSGVNSLSDYFNSNYSTTANINYRYNEKHSIAVNNVNSGSTRKVSTNLPPEEMSVLETMRRSNFKNVLGVSYRYRHSRNWNANLFVKNYLQRAKGPFNEGDEAHPNYLERKENYSANGYGIATTYFIKNFQIKASAERALRLPTENELFGDEILEAGNSTLKAENSMNLNLGATMNHQFKNENSLYVDVSTYYRDTQDYIRRVALQRSGGIVNLNHGKVRNLGVDLEAQFYYKNKAMIGGNLTYQDLRNREGLRSATGSAESGTYNDRMPNVPYLFGGANAAYYWHGLGGKGNTLNINYSLNFVGEFYLYWESQGDPSQKKTLPQQLSHDLSLTYIVKNGRYNFTLEGKNLTNEEMFDNFSLMKPGRAIYGKVRYYFMQRKK